jgi:hypothetical protein
MAQLDVSTEACWQWCRGVDVRRGARLLPSRVDDGATGLMLAVAQNRCQAVHGAAESMLGVEQYRYRGDIRHDVADHHANMTSCPGAHMHGSKIEKASHDECH